ncbi:hypothetical protein TWF694_001065 [Orbilia ellipsospora]|uniref:Rhamnogalacturonase A/B/Epimerase-like pectate lyase domain-containing protein n=1 Tax=Orbilia ellipsospora TaxID=2528407 RepID=A0AAV9XT52_9PEZI
MNKLCFLFVFLLTVLPISEVTANRRYDSKSLGIRGMSPDPLDTIVPRDEETEIDAALKVVQDAQIKQGKINVNRYKHPLRNHQTLRPDKRVQGSHGNFTDSLPKSVNQALEYVAKHHAKSKGLPKKHAKRTSFWMESMTHGSVPGGVGYAVWRNVKTYGAVGDGVADDTAAINRAMSTGGRCGQNCGSSTRFPALVYFPSGTYLISSPIIQYYNTQIVGNAADRPTIKGSSSFIGLGLISSDVYIPGASGAEWYINQNNFLRQIRNVIIDTTSIPNVMQGQDIAPAAIHWQVAQVVMKAEI